MWVVYVDIWREDGNELVRKSVAAIDKRDSLFVRGNDMVNRIVHNWKDSCRTTNRYHALFDVWTICSIICIFVVVLKYSKGNIQRWVMECGYNWMNRQWITLQSDLDINHGFTFIIHTTPFNNMAHDKNLTKYNIDNNYW